MEKRQCVGLPHTLGRRQAHGGGGYKRGGKRAEMHTFLGLLAKIKCSICSYQFNI
jgi:hypothetical protein